MPTAPLIFTDAVDSFYSYVRGRIKVVNPNRDVKGMLEAQDWPKKPLDLDAFYLLVLGEAPIGKQGFSESTRIQFHQVQWVWVNKGTETAPTVRQANRGDRYRVAQIMKGELTQGLFPGSTEKLTWGLNNAGTFVGSSIDPAEFIMWQPITFHEKVDSKSGLIYCSGSVRVVDMFGPIS